MSQINKYKGIKEINNEFNEANVNYNSFFVTHSKLNSTKETNSLNNLTNSTNIQTEYINYIDSSRKNPTLKTASTERCSRCFIKQIEIVCLDCMYNINSFCTSCDNELHNIDLLKSHKRYEKLLNKSREPDSINQIFDEYDLTTTKTVDDSNDLNIKYSKLEHYELTCSIEGIFNEITDFYRSKMNELKLKILCYYNFKSENEKNNIKLNTITDVLFNKIIGIKTKILEEVMLIKLTDENKKVENMNFIHALDINSFHKNKLNNETSYMKSKLLNFKTDYSYQANEQPIDSKQLFKSNDTNINSNNKLIINFPDERLTQCHETLKFLHKDLLNQIEKSKRLEFAEYKQLEEKILDTIDCLNDEISHLKQTNLNLRNYIGELEVEVEIMKRDKDKWTKDFKYSEDIVKRVTADNIEKTQISKKLSTKLTKFDRICFGKITKIK